MMKTFCEHVCDVSTPALLHEVVSLCLSLFGNSFFLSLSIYLSIYVSLSVCISDLIFSFWLFSALPVGLWNVSVWGEGPSVPLETISAPLWICLKRALFSGVGEKLGVNWIGLTFLLSSFLANKWWLWWVPYHVIFYWVFWGGLRRCLKFN